MTSNSVIRVKSVVRGYHVYMAEWDPSIGDHFDLEIEENNRHDRFAVAIIVDESIVGHVPKEFSKIVYYFLRNGCHWNSRRKEKA